ncbi:MAG: FecR family protein [Spirochaetota bacterium]
MKPQRLLTILMLAAVCVFVAVSCKPRHAEEDDFIKDFNIMTDKSKDTNAHGKAVQADKAESVTATVWDSPMSAQAREALRVLWRGKPVEMKSYFEALNVDAADGDKGELCHLKGVAYFLLAKKDRSLKTTAVECFEKANQTTGKQKFKVLSMLWLGMTYYSYYSDAESLKKGMGWLDRVTEEYPRTRFANDAVLYKALTKRQLGQSEEYKELLLGLERGGYPDIYVYWIPMNQYVRAKDAVNYLLRGVPFNYYGGGGGYVAASGSITEAKGTYAVKANGADVKTNIGAKIAAGYEVITDADGEVTVDLKTIGVVKIAPLSSVQFKKLSPASGTAGIVVTKGKAMFAVPKLGKKSTYAIDTGSANLKVTGTAFSVASDGTTSKVAVLRGVIDITNAGGYTNVTELQEADISSSNSMASVAVMQKSTIEDVRGIVDIKGVEKYESKEALTDKVDRVTMRVAKEEAEAARKQAESAKAQAEARAKTAEADKVKAQADAKAANDAKAKAEKAAADANSAKAASDKAAADAKAAKEKAEKDKAAADKAAADAKAAADKAKTTTTTTTTSTNKAATTTTTTTSTNKKKAADDW